MNQSSAKRTRSTRRVPRRSAFSLIELLAVIVIIAILMALILPAINSVRSKARASETKAEITQLSSAIASFKSQFNVEPPSYLAIPADPADWDAAAFLPSKRRIRQIWGRRFDFTNKGGLGNSTDIELTGPECLVFFLGGVRSWDDTSAGGGNEDGIRDSGEVGEAIVGFSSNPSQPFAVDAGTRQGPFFEFDYARLTDLDGDGFYEYIDPLPDQQTPYMYLSSYGGTGYQSSDAVFYSDLGRDMLSPYMQSASQPWKDKSFQIVSPGFDFAYGTGGIYAEGTNLAQTLFDSSMVLQPNPAAANYNPLRGVETDNITNFSEGTELN